MFIGVSFKLRDRRVDRMLAKASLPELEIFYSPLEAWLIGIGMLLPVIAPLLIWLLMQSLYGLLVAPYLATSYLINARLNNSVAIHGDQVIFVNPNFPFRHVTVFWKGDIQQIEIDAEKSKWKSYFLVSGFNFLEVKTHDETQRFYCTGLMADAFDENWTEKTIENLEMVLKESGFPVNMKSPE